MKDQITPFSIKIMANALRPLRREQEQTSIKSSRFYFVLQSQSSFKIHTHTYTLLDKAAHSLPRSVKARFSEYKKQKHCWLIRSRFTSTQRKKKRKRLTIILFVQKANCEMLFRLLPAANRRTSVCETPAGWKDRGQRLYGEGFEITKVESVGTKDIPKR